jgi:hypothetical protein
VAHKGITTALFALLLLAAAVPNAAGDWPDKMTTEELARHTNVHDGYVVRVLPSQSAPVQQSATIARSESTLDYVSGYSSKRKEWIPLPDAKMRGGLSWIGVRATLRAVQTGGENWQLVATTSEGRTKRLFPVTYQAASPRGGRDCFFDYLTQDQFCEGRTAHVLWFVEAKCFQPGTWTFVLQDQPGGPPGAGELKFLVPGRAKPVAIDPCEVKSTPVTEHDTDPDERAFQMLAQREIAFSGAGPVTGGTPSRFPAPSMTVVSPSKNAGSGADGALSIQLVSTGDVLLTDGKGSKTGVDSSDRMAMAEIPGSLYQRRPPPPSLASDPHAAPLRFLSVSRPEPGSYVLAVHCTHGDPYYLTVGMNQLGRGVTLIQADDRVSSDIEYRIVVTSDSRRLRVIGGFDGNLRSIAKDQLLTFASPTGSRTQLPSGTTETQILMFYAPGIRPDSLGAKLNGKDVMTRFHPYAGWREVVRLPLEPGDNILDIGIKGSIAGKRAAEKKRLTFTVMK